MQSWFYLDNPKRPKNIKKDMSIMENQELEAESRQILSQLWEFTVIAPDVGSVERVFLTGSTPELGEWDYRKAVVMEPKPGTELWAVTVSIPNTSDVQYRYAIGLRDDERGELVPRRCETHIHPRVIDENMIHPQVDNFGEINGKTKVCRGWLTSQTMVQFKFMDNPLKLKSRLTRRLMNIKVTPVKLSFGEETPVEDSLSIDAVETVLPHDVSIEVSTLDNDPALCELHEQEQFGREYRTNDVLIINVLTSNHNDIAYLVDFYSYSTRAAPEDPPCHIGYTYVLPNMLKPSEGTLQLPVTCNVKHRPLGSVDIQYMIVRPMEKQLCNLRVSYAKHWDPSWTGLEVGHRGLGASFKTKEGNAIRENTIASLKKAAASGADLLEFDVQLSKDMIPVIYHDYYVCISMKRKREVDFTEMLELPVKDLNLEQLQKLKVYHLVEGRNHKTMFCDEDLEEHQPFPTLEHALKSLDPHVGFNVELKWTMEMADGTFELNNPFDMNTYVDKVLETVLQHAGTRNIVFSCFNPDICTMVRRKQNKYPVMFLTVGVTNKYQAYRDLRCRSIPAAVQHAVCSDILGIVVHTEDLLRDPTQVRIAQDAGLVMFCWGDDNNDKQTIQRLKEMGLHAVIYDKLDQYSTKEVKESIFLVGMRESQRELMGLAAHGTSHVVDVTNGVSGVPNGGSGVPNGGSGVPNDGSDVPNDGSGVVNVGPRQTASRSGIETAGTLAAKLPERVSLLSTVTSLESLAENIALQDDERRSKRCRNVITPADKESQVKEQHNNFLGLFPSGDASKGSPKRSRNN